jgi:hypothetical protein
MLVKERIWANIKNFKIPYMGDSEKGKLEKCLEEAIRKDDGDVAVDWKKVVWLDDKTKIGDYYGTRGGIWSRLVDENILSRESEGNFCLLYAALMLNPVDKLPDYRSGSDWLYFTREEDAKAYRAAKFGNRPLFDPVDERIKVVKLR